MSTKTQTDAIAAFRADRAERTGRYPGSPLAAKAHDFLVQSAVDQYSYNFDWLSRPIIQYPQDIVAMQELIWRVRPDLIVETGIAHGGSLIFSASMLAMIEYCDALESGHTLDPRKPERQVIAVDIDIRAHNCAAIEAHPLSNRITMLEGSSTDRAIVDQIGEQADRATTVLVSLDSNHTHDHVLAELEAYAPMTSRGSYCVVFDTLIEDMPDDTYPDRSWGPGNNPKTAIKAYIDKLQHDGLTGREGDALDFEVDQSFDEKLLITVAQGGFLRRV